MRFFQFDFIRKQESIVVGSSYGTLTSSRFSMKLKKLYMQRGNVCLLSFSTSAGKKDFVCLSLSVQEFLWYNLFAISVNIYYRNNINTK